RIFTARFFEHVDHALIYRPGHGECAFFTGLVRLHQKTRPSVALVESEVVEIENVVAAWIFATGNDAVAHLYPRRSDVVHVLFKVREVGKSARIRHHAALEQRGLAKLKRTLRCYSCNAQRPCGANKNGGQKKSADFSRKCRDHRITFR